MFFLLTRSSKRPVSRLEPYAKYQRGIRPWEAFGSPLRVARRSFQTGKFPGIDTEAIFDLVRP